MYVGAVCGSRNLRPPPPPLQNKYSFRCTTLGKTLISEENQKTCKDKMVLQATLTVN